MAVDIQPLDELELWSRPGAGQLPRWVCGVILLACAITVVVVGASMRVLWQIEYLRLEEWTFRNGPPLGVLGVLVFAFLPRSSVSRFVRMALVVPIVHVLVLLVAWRGIPMLEMPLLAQRTPLMQALPVFPMTLLIAGVTITTGALIARRRRDRVHAIVMLALANLLLFGLWLPIASRLCAGVGKEASWDAALAALASPGLLVLVMLVPPFLVAIVFTAISVERPVLAQRLRRFVAFGVVLLFITSVATRMAAYHGGFLLYDNFLHLMFGVAMVAIVATCALPLVTWLEGRRTSRRLAQEPATRFGTISDEDGPIVACLQITSWLRGPRMVTRPFAAMVAGAELSVPAGIDVVTAIPRVSSVLRTGEAVVILRQGDRIELGGFVERDTGDSPFRSAQATLPGPAGVVVGRAGELGTTAQSMGLAAWRPSVAYMMIVIAVALPGLLGLFAPTWR